jgi:hypothetical protein
LTGKKLQTQLHKTVAIERDGVIENVAKVNFIQRFDLALKDGKAQTITLEQLKQLKLRLQMEVG